MLGLFSVIAGLLRSHRSERKESLQQYTRTLDAMREESTNRDIRSRDRDERTIETLNGLTGAIHDLRRDLSTVHGLDPESTLIRRYPG